MVLTKAGWVCMNHMCPHNGVKKREQENIAKDTLIGLVSTQIEHGP